MNLPQTWLANTRSATEKAVWEPKGLHKQGQLLHPRLEPVPLPYTWTAEAMGLDRWQHLQGLCLGASSPEESGFWTGVKYRKV